MEQKKLKKYIRSLVELHIMPGSALGKITKDFLYDKPGTRSRTVKDYLGNLNLDDKTRKEVETALNKGDKKTAKDLLKKSLDAKKIAKLEDYSLNEILGDFSMSGLRRMEAPGNFRAGSQVVGSRSSLQNDLEKESVDSNDAAVVLVRNGDKYLAVSRQDEFDNLNMPGGHIEVGEAPIDAAAREVQEETGLKVGNLKHLFVDDRSGKRVHVFHAGEFSGDLQSSHEGIASWEPEENLLNGQYCDTFKKAMKICR
jgi:8-oxo-dGTP pyrophosphatase MutT (NUDIX family)